MKLIFSEKAWEDYLYWQKTDKKILALDSCSSTETAKTALSRKRINLLIQDIKRSPFEGIGKPEPLKYDLSGYWSRRIDDEHRIVYKVQNDAIFLSQLRYHY